MLQDAKERTVWKGRLADWVSSASAWVSRPVCKLMAEVTLGVLSSGSLRQSEIARALCEPMRLHHTQKRLSRMLVSHSEVAWVAEQLQLERIGSRVTERMILAIDPGDLNRDGAAGSEYRGRVRDGDTGEIVSGYPLMSVVARDIGNGQTLPLLTRLLSSERAAHRSENTELLSVMETVQRHVPGSPLWVIDRGGDRGRLWRHWIEQDWPVLVRAANQRYWLWRDGMHTAQQIARQLPLKHQGRLRRGSARSVRFGLTRVSLREYPDRPLSMVVVRHGKREPLVLVSTRLVRGRRQGERLIQAYLDRWACEEGYRFSKQGFQLEGVQARRFSVLQNLVALASLAWALLAAYQAQAGHLMDKARRQKRGKGPVFPFYSLLAGWQRLFQSARRIYYHWWRKPQRPSGPITPDLFADSPTLIPIGP